MKKLTSVLIILFVLAIVFAFVSCDNDIQENNDTGIFSDESTEQIDVDYSSEEAVKLYFSKHLNNTIYNGEEKITADDVKILNDLGKLGEFNLYQMKSSKVDLEKYIKNETVGTFNLFYLMEEPTYLYSKGNFYTITEAYEKKIITPDIIVAYAQKVCYEFSIELSDYEKERKIDQELATEIKIAYAEFIGQPKLAGEVNISLYAGEVGYKIPVVKMSGDGLVHTQASRIENVAGYEITFTSTQPIYVYDEGKFYTLSGAYEKKVIHERDVYYFAECAGLEIKKNGMTALHPDDCDNIDPLLALEIKEAWASQGLGGLIIGEYWKIDDKHIIREGVWVEWGNRTRKIAGYEITHSYGCTFYVYKDGKFYKIAEAYEKGILSREDVYQFAVKTRGKIEEMSV